MSDRFYEDERVAESYDADTAGAAILRDDIPFYRDLAREAAAGGQGVLELGCGTGRVAIPLAQAGIDVTGLDLSPAMLAVAQRKSRGIENLTWVEGDMAAFDLGRRFGLVIIPWRSFLLLLTVAEQKSCLRCIHDHLVEGGRLALNIFNPDIPLMASWLTTRDGLWRREPAADARRDIFASTRYRPATQEIDERYLESVLSDDGAIIARVERNLRLRYVFRYEMEHLLALSGFEVEALYGWFDRRPFTDESAEMVWVARKP